MHLRYTGQGAWLPGYPARDIGENDVDAYTDEQLEEMLNSGIYEIVYDEDDVDVYDSDDSYNSVLEDDEED